MAWTLQRATAEGWLAATTVELNGRPVRQWSAGEGGYLPPVVMLPGLGFAGYLLPWVREMARWTAVTVLDLPGWHRGTARSCEPTVAGIAATTQAWLCRMAGPPVVLAGHSTGAQAALVAGLNTPDRLAGVVLAGPTVDPAARDWVRLVARYLAGVPHEVPGEVAALASSAVASSPRALVGLLNSALADRPEDHVLDLAVPALIMTGREDPVATPAWAGRLAGLARAELKILPGGHNGCFPYPAAADRALRDTVIGWAGAATG